MKKISLYVIVFMMFFICSCEKEPEILQRQITTSELIGDWEFQTLTFDGIIYNTEKELIELEKTFNYTQINLIKITNNIMNINIFTDRRGIKQIQDFYILNNNIINYRDGFLIFLIENSETFDGTILELQLISSNGKTTLFDTNYKPIGGIYTLQHKNN